MFLIYSAIGYRLTIDGGNGVREVIQNLLADIDLTMGLAGRKSIAEINVDILQF